MTYDRMPDAALTAQNAKRILDRLYEHHLRRFMGSTDNCVYISDEYPGLWLEHTFDSVVWARLSGEIGVAKAQVGLFLAAAKPDGQLPFSFYRGGPQYSHLQECVSIGSLCLDVYRMDGDLDFLQTAYRAVAGWIAWQRQNRMTRGRGLIETFCGYDTGHDNSGRLYGMKYHGWVDEKNAAAYPEGCDVAPMLSPDVNAVYFGNLKALAAMAEALGRPDEQAEWERQAAEVRQRIFDTCYNPDDGFFYDVDRHDRQRPCRSIAVTALFVERVLDNRQGNDLFDRYFRNPEEFGTPIPYPAVSAADSSFHKNCPGNTWGYFCQGLTMLRTLRWMDAYGLSAELERNMRIWVNCQNAAALPFGQELDPFTGEASVCSPWYSSCMLFYLASAVRLGLFTMPPKADT